MISFIIPAHNEEAALARTLPAIHAAAASGAPGRPYEIIVADDASTDGTAAVARRHGAVVVPVQHRQISATRNSGARAAQGDRFFFIDADTIINGRVVKAALRCMDNGAAGGGAAPRFDSPVPVYVRIIEPLAALLSKLAGVCGGACLFCTSAAFHKTGGFNERVFAGEEGFFIFALKQQGRFILVWPRVLTSGRRLRTMSGLQILASVARIACKPTVGVTQRSNVQHIWYDSNRARDSILPRTWAVRLSNAVTLVLLLLWLTGPAWNFIPWSWTPRGSALGYFRMADGFFLSHVGLILWPIAGVLLWTLMHRRNWIEWFKTAALLAFCTWQAWDSTYGVIWHWKEIWHWLA